MSWEGDEVMMREEELRDGQITSILSFWNNGFANGFEEDRLIKLAQHDVERLAKEVRRLQEIELLHNGLSEHLAKIEKENELLINTSPLMCTMKLEKENQRLKEEAKAIEGLKGYEDYLVVQRGFWDSQQENRRYKQALEEIENIVGGMGARNLYHIRSHILCVIQKALKKGGD
jgi:hypothetical protein